MNTSQLKQFETRLWVIRQMKQVSASLLVGVSTLIFLDSIHVLSSVLHALETAALFPYMIVFVAYSVCGAFSLGILARYAFIRHMKRVEVDIERAWLKRKQAEVTAKRSSFKLVRGPVRQHDTSYEPSRQLRRA
ncbi:hypothetical protein EV673_1875 [Limnobacter thiooxidans]|uniref:Uncharacterized protein n=1 Tax=Limnobacter thiooxidans TaxID=131080 RepID=A0AA86J1S8_9BURK|nr:hypothetical protein [Limnobacter sp.]MCZ8016050.1 hypothetical protein [Limnobacter sp.]RZS40116.1 hypothetical protein EV673_1875 [Limnobacter thiooxidans]BET27453.1 hypothetical protein RGQ30_29540 [Limnobacter thiooxidans]